MYANCDVVNPNDSSTYKVTQANAFHITYGDGSGADGDYFTDNFQIGNASVTNLEMGIAQSANLTQGLLGIGYTVNEASNTDANQYSTISSPSFTYPNIIDSMLSQGLIATNAYSLYLDDLDSSTGSIIFGGLDSDKYHGDLVQMPVVPEQLVNGSTIYADFAVALTSFSLSTTPGNSTLLTSNPYNHAVVLDSGTALTYLPTRLAQTIYQSINAYDDSQSYAGTGLVYANCDLLTSEPDLTFDFGFGGTSGSKNITIRVPANELILQPSALGLDLTGYVPTDITFQNVCILGILSADQEPYILGDTFLRSAYVVYDLKNNVIAVAQTNFNSTTSSIVEFSAGETGIPLVSGVASSAQVTETATGKAPVGGSKTSSGAGKTTTSSSGSTTASATGSSSGSSGSGSSSSGSGATGSAGSIRTGSSTSAAASTATSKAAGVRTVPAIDPSALMVLCGSAALAVLGGSVFLA